MKMKMKKRILIDGIFYNTFWRFRNDDPGSTDKIETFNASLVIAILFYMYPFLLYGISEFYCLNISIFENLTNNQIYTYFAIVNVLVLIYYFCRYKKIIKEHDKYNNKKYKIITVLYIVSIFLSPVITGFFICLK
jgi:hypothetical protein